MNTATIKKVITIITYTERVRTLMSVDTFLREREYRRGIADPDVVTLRDMVKERIAEIR